MDASTWVLFARPKARRPGGVPRETARSEGPPDEPKAEALPPEGVVVVSRLASLGLAGAPRVSMPVRRGNASALAFESVELRPQRVANGFATGVRLHPLPAPSQVRVGETGSRNGDNGSNRKERSA